MACGGLLLAESSLIFLILSLILFFNPLSENLGGLFYLLSSLTRLDYIILLSEVGPLSVYACCYSNGSSLLALFPRNLDFKPENDGIFFIGI